MPRFNRAVLLYNANAGQSLIGQVLSQSVPSLAKETKTLELIQTASAKEFADRCKETAKFADAIFVAGGDGTVHLAVQALTALDSPPVLGILPSGTCNDFARTLNIPLDLEEAAEVLVTGEAKEIDTATANENSFLNFAGVGLIVDISASNDAALKERYGKLSYFINGLRALRESIPFSITLQIDGSVYQEEAVLVLVMNGRSIGTHQVPLASLDPSDGLLDVFIIQASSLATVLEWFSLSNPDTLEEELEHVLHLQGRHVSIQTDPIKQVDTDGEIYLKTPVDIEVHPKKLKILVPKKTG